MKIAVILLGQGHPDHFQAVQGYLYRLYREQVLLPMPVPLQKGLAFLMSIRQQADVAQAYARIGGGSNLVKQMRTVGLALEKALSGDAKRDVHVVLATRYATPTEEDAVAQIKKFGPDSIVVLPLYPQYSLQVSEQAFLAWKQASAGLSIPTTLIRSWAGEDGLAQAFADSTRAVLEKAADYGRPRLLLTAHGVPLRALRKGDPFVKQCTLTAKAVIGALELPSLDYALCWRSRGGPLKWQEPSLESEIIKAGAEGTPLVVAAISNLTEAPETLLELDADYANLAAERGVPVFLRVPAPGPHPALIAGLAALVERALPGQKTEA